MILINTEGKVRVKKERIKNARVKKKIEEKKERGVKKKEW